MTGTDRSLVPWIDRRIKYQQQESFTWTSPTTPQFNLTKIDHNRLIVRCILRTISYEISVYDHTTDLHEISCSNPHEWWCHDDVTITSTPESDWLQHRKGQLMTHQRLAAIEERLKWTSIGDTTMKRRLKTSDSQLSQSQFNNILYIKLRQTISIE